MGLGNQNHTGIEACLFDINQPFYFENEKSPQKSNDSPPRSSRFFWACRSDNLLKVSADNLQNASLIPNPTISSDIMAFLNGSQKWRHLDFRGRWANDRILVGLTRSSRPPTPNTYSWLEFWAERIQGFLPLTAALTE